MICDFAETYHVYDWRGLPLRTAAALAFGLSADSRVKVKLYGERIGTDTLLWSLILDQLQVIRWYQTDDGIKGQNPPEMMTDTLLGIKRENKTPVTAFATPQEFEARRQSIIGGQDG